MRTNSMPNNRTLQQQSRNPHLGVGQVSSSQQGALTVEECWNSYPGELLFSVLETLN